MLPQYSGGLSLVQVDAEVYGRRIYVDFTGMFPEFVPIGVESSK
jgi:hypothetical protein